jgi:hypothetical protein
MPWKADGVIREIEDHLLPRELKNAINPVKTVYAGRGGGQSSSSTGSTMQVPK